jgi:type II secretory pathway pseudopilin PulG
MKSATLFPQKRRNRTEAFTLVEVLVACAVLVLLVVMVAEMVGSATSVTSASKKRLDADDEARLVFDRMDADIALMLKRPDVSPLFVTNANSNNDPNDLNDAFYFYSQAPASSTNTTVNNSQIALIGYRIVSTNQDAQSNGLTRLGVEESWDALSFITNVSTNGVDDTNYHLIAPSVFRMEFALLMKPGSTNNSTNFNIGFAGPVPSNTVSTNGTNVFFQTNNLGQSLKDVAGIVVALAILDPTSQKIIGTNALTTLAAKMEDAVVILSNNVSASMSGGIINGGATNGIPVDSWKTNALNYSETGLSVIPKAARSEIRIYQRYFPIN